jgi:hypothetical protein
VSIQKFGQFFHEHVLRVAAGVVIGLTLSIFIFPANAQERNKLDRPKDAQELCGYTLKEGQVVRLGHNNAYVKLDRPGTVQDNLGIFTQLVCAFPVQNVDVNPESVTIVYVDFLGATNFNMIQRGDFVAGVLLSYRLK